MFSGGVRVVSVSEIRAEVVSNAEKTKVKILFSPKETPTFAMRVFEVDVGGHIPAHKHPWEHEIFVLNGEIRVKVEEKVFILKPGMAIYIPPCVVHEYWNIGESVAKFICIIPNKPTASC